METLQAQVAALDADEHRRAELAGACVDAAEAQAAAREVPIVGSSAIRRPSTVATTRHSRCVLT